MSEQAGLLKKLLNAISSSKVAIALILFIVLCGVIGIFVPQQGKMDNYYIQTWQNANPSITAILKPLGLFSAFHSWPFIIVLVLLAVNVTTNAALKFKSEGGFEALKGPDALKMTGFLVLHAALLTLFVGGFMTSTLKLDANTLITEGATFVDHPNSYLKLTKGPLRPEVQKDFLLLLKDVQFDYGKDKYATEMASSIDVYEKNEKIADAVIKVNQPYTYKDMKFNIDGVGFSPRVAIYENKSNDLVFEADIPLRTIVSEKSNTYTNQLLIPFLQNQTTLTLYPGHKAEFGQVVKTSETPNNPLLIIEQKDENGNVLSKNYLPLSKKIAIGEVTFEFKELKQWASFKVTADPGYPVICAAFVLGLIALAIKYIPRYSKADKQNSAS
ncbi:MAG: cytochrome c biogenesis protein ResB [Planctomycetes bacterium]|nr:cytochrome c biogenesis protein ResB [Planctomycetota bacterium]